MSAIDISPIRKGVSLPPRGNAKYPFGDMEVGDMVEIKGISIQGVSTRLRHYRPKAFTCRTLAACIGVWRIK